MFEKFDIDDRNIFKVCVIATMSSGKSTFINSIIGEEIMPEKNEACTARTMAVLDNDSIKNKLAHIIRKNGDKEIVEIDNRDVLDRVNNDEDVADFVVETNIMNIANTSKALMLVDTPGVNNSEDERHGQRTEEFLQQLDSGVIIYLMNATQLATNDDSILLQLVSEHVKKQKGNVKIFFVINKIDALDTETESYSGTVSIAKEYIENHGIKNPTIYPMSALAAKTLRMALYRREMTRRELRKLEDIYDHYRSKDNSMMAFAMSDELSGEQYEIGEYTVSAQELQRAIDNTGITAVEKRIETYMRDMEQHFAPEIVIKSSMSDSSAQKYQDRLNKLVKLPSNSSVKLFSELVNTIENDKVISGLNYFLGSTEEENTMLDIIPDMTEISESFDSLIENIEKTKSYLFELFSKKTVLGAKHKKGIYFIPTNSEKEKINSRFMFYVSNNGNSWKLVKFGEISKLIEEKKEFFLFNAYIPFVFRVKNDNANDIIPLLDIKLPIRFVRIAKCPNSQMTIDEVHEHIKLLINEDAAHQREIHEAEEQLKRTYKGVVFNSEKEKNAAIELEKEVDIFCQSLGEKNFDELYAFKQKVSTYPSAIFANYVTKLVSALDIQENREKNSLSDRIEIAELDEISKIATEIGKHNYSDTTRHLLEKSIEVRRIKCQRNILEIKTKDITGMNRSELTTLRNDIKKLKFDDSLIEEYEESIQRQYDTREIQELRTLCSDIDQYDINGLLDLESRIKKEDYQDKHTKQYFEIILSRIEHLHLQNIESLCCNVEGADRNTLNTIRKAVEDEDCRGELKESFFERINRREEQIDYDDLCNLTVGLERKSIDELENILEDLFSGEYNEKFVKEFQLRTKVALERSQYAYLSDLINNINQMSKTDIQKIVDLIKSKKYPDRVSSLINSRIEERIYVLDMYELMKQNNEFDNLSLEDISSLKRRLKEQNVCQRSKDTYLKRLSMREVVIGYEKVSPLACFVKQNIDQMRICRYLNIKLATFSQDYIVFLEKHFEMLGKRNYEDIPVIILPDCSSFALTKTSFFCRTSSGYTEYRLDSIQTINVEKKLFSEYIKITMATGNVVSITSGINKNNANMLVSLLLLISQNIGNTSMLSQYQPYQDIIYPLKEEDFEVASVPSDVSIQTVAGIFISRLIQLSGKTKMPSIKYAGNDSWKVAENKVLAGFGINAEKHLLMYYDRTLFNSAKDGVAFGEYYIHIKAANQSLISIPYLDIVNVDYLSNSIRLSTIKNGVFTSEFVMMNEEDGKMIADIVDEYAKGVQFIEYNVSKSIVVEEKINETQKSDIECPSCGALLKVGAKFCSQCGKKMGDTENIIQEYCFCSNCGNKMLKGKKFCSSCGCKAD